MKRTVPSSLVAAGAILSLIALWVLSGLIGGNAKPATLPARIAKGKAETPLPIQRVRVRAIAAQKQVARLTVSGQTRPARTVVVKAETSGQVAEVLVEKGERVAADQVMVRLKEGERLARLAEAHALVHRREVEYEAAKALEQKAFASRIRLAESRAELDAARAQLAHIQGDLDRTRLRAPFAGIIESRPVEVGDFVSVGGAVARVVDLDPVVVIAEVTEREVAAITLGTVAEAVLSTGQRLSGTVSYVATVATPATRTFPVEVSITNSAGTVPAGLTAELHLLLQRRSLHAIPPSALTLDEAGRVGIKTVTGSDVVTFSPVSIIASGADGLLWVADPGLPHVFRLITVGQEFVKVGQTVEAMPEAVPETSGVTLRGTSS